MRSKANRRRAGIGTAAIEESLRRDIPGGARPRFYESICCQRKMRPTRIVNGGCPALLENEGSKA